MMEVVVSLEYHYPTSERWCSHWNYNGLLLYRFRVVLSRKPTLNVSLKFAAKGSRWLAGTRCIRSSSYHYSLLRQIHSFVGKLCSLTQTLLLLVFNQTTAVDQTTDKYFTCVLIDWTNPIKSWFNSTVQFLVALLTQLMLNNMLTDIFLFSFLTLFSIASENTNFGGPKWFSPKYDYMYV